MGRCRTLALTLPLLFALLATQVARKGTYSGPPFTSVPIWTIPSGRATQSSADARSSSDWALIQDTLRRAIDYGTPVIIRGGVNHWPAVSSWDAPGTFTQLLDRCAPEGRLLLQTTVVEQDGGKGVSGGMRTPASLYFALFLLRAAPCLLHAYSLLPTCL